MDQRDQRQGDAAVKTVEKALGNGTESLRLLFSGLPDQPAGGPMAPGEHDLVDPPAGQPVVVGHRRVYGST